MAWEPEVVESVRVLINDMDESPKYCDSRLERAAVIACTQMLNELSFTTAYVVDIPGASITPDPTESDPKDVSFITLLSLKTASLIVNGELRQYTLSGVRIVDGPSSIDMVSIVQNLRELAKGIDIKYERAKTLFQCGQGGQAIITPTTVSNLYPYY